MRTATMDESIKKVMEFIDKKSKNSCCDWCKNNGEKWMAVDGVFYKNKMGHENEYPSGLLLRNDEGITPVLMISCKSCGNTKLFNFGFILMLIEDGKKNG